MTRFRLWDLPTRVCHWLLALCVTGAVASAKIGGSAMLWHGRCGLAILGLLVFRLAWGVLGSTYARFGQFVRGPAAIRAYLRGEWHAPGHNPLGALSVLALLGVPLALVATGMFGNDDSNFEGPLYALVSKDASDILTRLHHRLEPLLFGLVGLHLAAIAYYVRVKGDNLLRPMLSGWKAGHGADARGGGLLALVVSLLLAAAAVYGASGAWLPPPAPMPAATPGW